MEVVKHAIGTTFSVCEYGDVCSSESCKVLLYSCERVPMGGASFKRGVGVFSSVFIFNYKTAPILATMPLKQIIGQTIMYNGATSL